MGSVCWGVWVSFWGNKNILKLIVMMDVQLWEYTKNHLILYFKWVNSMQCKLYLKKAVFKRDLKMFIEQLLHFEYCLHSLFNFLTIWLNSTPLENFSNLHPPQWLYLMLLLNSFNTLSTSSSEHVWHFLMGRFFNVLSSYSDSKLEWPWKFCLLRHPRNLTQCLVRVGAW